MLFRKTTTALAETALIENTDIHVLILEEELYKF